MNKTVTLSSIILALSLTACSSGPSDGDIEDAIIKVTDQALERIPEDNRNKFEVLSLENTKCEELDSDNYKCTFDIETMTTLPSSGLAPIKDKKTTTVKLAERDDGWTIVQ